MTYYGRTGTPYTMDTRLGGGGEGEVYSISGHSDLVAKLYFEDKKFTPSPNNPNPRQYMREKIETMLDQPVDAYINGVLSIAWPQDSLYDHSGKFVGFTMPRVNSKHHIFAASRERERLQLFPKYTWKTAIIIAYNLSLAVNEVHRSGAVVGDMNSNNIMLDDHGRVTLIDTDSFNIRNNRTGKLYKCSVGVPECLPPELQGKNLSESANQFTKETDNFALSVHIFNLLMNNCHPFGCTGLNSGQSSSSTNPVASNITKGNCPYVTGGKGTPSPKAPDVAMLPSSIRSLVDRAFSYDVYTAVRSETITKRPSAAEWLNALYSLLQQPMTACSVNDHHVYPTSYGKCPWCPTETKPKPPAAPINQPAQISTGTGGSVGGTTVSTPSKKKTKPWKRIRRESWPFWLINILAGLIITPFSAPLLLPLISDWFDFVVPETVAYIVLLLFGAGAGAAISYFLQEKYQTARKGGPWLLFALLVPLAAVLAVAIVAVVVGVVAFLAIAALYIAGAIFTISCLCNMCSG